MYGQSLCVHCFSVVFLHVLFFTCIAGFAFSHCCAFVNCLPNVLLLFFYLLFLLQFILFVSCVMLMSYKYKDN